jgi:hypothetical protein
MCLPRHYALRNDVFFCAHIVINRKRKNGQKSLKYFRLREIIHKPYLKQTHQEPKALNNHTNKT